MSKMSQHVLDDGTDEADYAQLSEDEQAEQEEI